MVKVQIFLILMMYSGMVPAGGFYGTALQAAGIMGRSTSTAFDLERAETSFGVYREIITLLLENGAQPNLQGAIFVISRMYDQHSPYRW
jgi:hypothetical protein